MRKLPGGQMGDQVLGRPVIDTASAFSLLRMRNGGSLVVRREIRSARGL